NPPCFATRLSAPPRYVRQRDEQGHFCLARVFKRRPPLPAALPFDDRRRSDKAPVALGAALLWRIFRDTRTGAVRSSDASIQPGRIFGTASFSRGAASGFLRRSNRSLVARQNALLRCGARADLDLLAARAPHSASPDAIDGLPAAARQTGTFHLRPNGRHFLGRRRPDDYCRSGSTGISSAPGKSIFARSHDRRPP